MAQMNDDTKDTGKELLKANNRGYSSVATQ